ncbi:LysR family transcriptional regulator [Dietzia sp.]|uniref:LysR family transcriptional regulator n=1 Tax=Dietzia sp. TaxID=1871616 RepID=UPI002FD9B3C3
MSLSARVPDLDLLDSVVATARCGSMGAAAHLLGLSQQAVSARVRTAERLLGVVVFVRSPSGVAPTDSGRSILTWADEVLRAAAALDAGAADLRGDPLASASVAVSNTVSEWLFPKWAATVRRQNPQAKISAIPGNSEQVLDAVQSDRVDLGFVEGPTIPRTVSSLDVARDELVVVVPPEHAWAVTPAAAPTAATSPAPSPCEPAPVSAETLGMTPLVMREQGSGTRTTFESALATLGITVVPPLMEFGSTAAVREAVFAADAPAVLSSLAVQRDLADRRLVRVPVSGVAFPRTLRAVWNPRRRPRGLAADLLAAAVAFGPGQASHP